MQRGSRLVTCAIGGWLLWGASASVRAQPAQPTASDGQHWLASLRSSQASQEVAPGSIVGGAWDERGVPIVGAVITAIGTTTTFGVTNDRGRFEIRSLPSGAYVIRAVAQGHAPFTQRVVVRPRGRSSSLLAMRRSSSSPTILAAGIGAVGVPPSVTTESSSDDPDGGDVTEPTAEARTGDAEETVWRLRHARRSVLKDASMPVDLLVDRQDIHRAKMIDLLGRAVSSPARAATSFFADTPFTGQVRLLTASMFESPRQLVAGGNLSQGTAYVKLSAPAGEAGDWTVRGALTHADIASWAVAGTYRTSAPQRHHYNLGLSYSTQSYGGGHPLALREVTEGSRNAGQLFGFDTFTISPGLALTYGARYDHYDYLDRQGLLSPSVGVTLTPAERLRVRVAASSRADAPGAGEFAQPSDDGIWLPPQRTFSGIHPGAPFQSARTSQVAGEVERDLPHATVSVRGFRQQVDNQLVTVFGAEVPGYESVKIGHYFVGAAGRSQAAGGTVTVQSTIARRVRTSVAYSLASAQLVPDWRPDAALLTSITRRPATERLQDVTTAINAELPETSTKILVLYRVGNGYARPAARLADAPTGVDSRFDIQVRQSLPFLDFTNARWEMLLAIRNFLREAELDQSVYDELLAVRPPKRLVGGVTLHF